MASTAVSESLPTSVATTTETAQTTGTLHLLTSPRSTFIAQGAEAKVYKAYLSASDFPTLTLRSSPTTANTTAPASTSAAAGTDPYKLSKADLKHARSVPFHTLIPSGESPDNHDGESPSQDATHQTVPIFLKHRFEKGYRHPQLDKSLTKARVVGEARAVMKCLRAGVNVPGLRILDAPSGVLGLEWIEGVSVRRLLPDDSPEEEIEPDTDLSQPQLTLDEFNLTVGGLMELIGIEIAKMHLGDIIHGDLTTSNMMLRMIPAFSSTSTSSSESKPQLVLIDFGLSYVSSLTEDKAVDLYVLERAFASTHPEPGDEIFEDMNVDSATHTTSTSSSRPQASEAHESTNKDEADGDNNDDDDDDDGDDNDDDGDDDDTASLSPAVTSTLFTLVLSAYEKRMGPKAWAPIERRLNDVRLRGRKRSMIG